jgi:hypothetical protein
LPTPALVDAAKNRLLDSTAGSPAWPPSHLGLGSGDPSTTGANELAGGSYARVPITWAAAASGARALSGTPYSVNVPAGSTVRWYLFFSASTSGTYYGCVPAGSGSRRAFSVPDATNDILESPAHGLSNAQKIVVWPVVGAALPTGLSEGTVYHVRDVTTDDFKLAATAGGAAIDLTAIGDGEWQLIVEETFSNAGIYRVDSASIELPG